MGLRNISRPRSNAPALECYVDAPASNHLEMGSNLMIASVFVFVPTLERWNENVVGTRKTLKLEQIYATILYITCIINKRLMAIFLNGLSMKIKCSISRLKILLQQ
jgi:hypothetical protein